MARICIKNFGPIKAGCVESDGWLDFAKVTALCGPQGSGKSTVAKVFAFFTWLEKVLTRGDHREDVWRNKKKFPKDFNDFHNVSEYFRPETILKYEGGSYSFAWERETFSINKISVESSAYSIPKIMYVPAERNFMSVIDTVDQIKKLPQNLKIMIKEFLDACKYFSDGIEYPVDGFSFKYDKFNRISKILVANGGEVRLSAASSGLQSMTPLFLVSEYLYRQMIEEKDASKQMSLAAYRATMENVFAHLSVEELPDAIRQGLSQYNAALTRRFVNIVEEPEQNLFPSSQRRVLFKLLEYAKGTSKFPDNQLLFTTHSPYMIEYLKLVTLAADIPNIINSEAELLSGLTGNSLIAKENVILYETRHDGTIVKLAGEDGFMPDRNSLHAEFDDIDNDYATVLSRQCGC